MKRLEHVFFLNRLMYNGTKTWLATFGRGYIICLYVSNARCHASKLLRKVSPLPVSLYLTSSSPSRGHLAFTKSQSVSISKYLFTWSKLRFAARIMLVFVLPLGSPLIDSKMSPTIVVRSLYLNLARKILSNPKLDRKVGYNSPNSL